MKKMTSLIAAATAAALLLTGCTVVKIGEEGKYTGETEFSADAQSSSDWSKVVEEIKSNAAEAAGTLSSDFGKAAAVTGEADVVEYNTSSPKHYLVLTMDGYTGDKEVRLQIEGPNTSTALRDLQTVREFKDFTNQTEWSEYAKSLNNQAVTNICDPLDLDNNDPAGKKVTFTGGASLSAAKDAIIIVPVELTIE